MPPEPMLTATECIVKVNASQAFSPLTKIFDLFHTLFIYHTRKKAGKGNKQGKGKTEAASVKNENKREADNDGTEEVVFGKKPKLESVSPEEFK